MSSSKMMKRVKYALRFLPDRAYIQLYYFAHFKKLCNLRHPMTYNEKLNWLKLHDHNPLYPTMVDKYEAKAYVAERIGWEHIIPTLGVWDRFDDIDFDALPNAFVLKCTHDSEGVVVIKDKKSMDKAAVKQKLEAALRQNFFYIGREWPYKNVKPRIIAEQYMEDHVDGELRDYKFFCFDGEPKALLIASERTESNVFVDFYDMDFNHLDFRQKHLNSPKILRKPDTFEQMKTYSRILSEGFCHIRVDFYEVNEKVYFGELTLYNTSGLTPFYPNKWDKVFGDWLKLPEKF